MQKRRCILTSALLALVLTLGAFGGWVGVAAEAQAEEPRKLSIMMAEQLTLEDVDTNFATQWIEEQLNVELTFNLLPNQQWTDKFEIMVSANEKLSDILFGSTQTPFVGKHADSGVFIDITDLYEEHSVYMKPILEQDEELKMLQFFADGRMYAVARVQRETHTEYTPKFFINETWLETLGLPIPETTEELLDTLRAFRDDDPNQNGIKDEIPLTGDKDIQPLRFIMGAFTFVNTRNLLQVEDGVLNAAYTTDGWREGLRYLNLLYGEGLIDPMLFTQDSAQLKAVMQKEGDIIAGSSAQMNSTHLFDQNPNAFEYVATTPFKGPDGTQYAPYQTFSVTYNGMITRDCADPVLAFQLLDFCWDLDASMVIRYGEQGVDWEWLPEGTKGRYTDSLGVPGKVGLTSAVQTGVQNKWWNVWSPLYLDYSICDGRSVYEPGDVGVVASEGMGKLYGHIPDEVVGILMNTPEELTELNAIKTNLDLYWKESFALFILGDKSLDKEWDSYLSELESIGLSRYLELNQIAYDRMRE